MIQDILAELKKRDAIVTAISAIIDARYIVTSESTQRLRRGAVQEDIFSILGVTKNNLLCGIVNDQMKKRGCKLIMNRGDQYYSNLIRRSPNQYV